MNEDSETQYTGGEGAVSAQEQQPDPGDPPPIEAEAGSDPSEGTPVGMTAPDAVDPDDDRDVRVPRDPHDTLAEASPTQESELTAELSMEDEIRRMAAEAPSTEADVAALAVAPVRVEDAPAALSNSDPENPEVLQAAEQDLDEAGLGPEERQMKAEAVLALREEERAEEAATTMPGVKPAAKPAPSTAMTAAHEAFSSAIRAHSRAKGLHLIDQTSFLQILHRPTGHKVYMALSVKTLTVHIETTLPVAGLLGTVEPKKDNGRIQAVMDPAVDDGDELVNVMSLIDLLASGQHGPLPPPKRRTLPAQ